MAHGLTWYWHRLRAMDLAELRERFAHRVRQRADARRPPDFRRALADPVAIGNWPALPDRHTVPAEVEQSLRRDLAEILSGHWRAFGHLTLRVDHPPKWFTDHAARRNFPTGRPGSRLNHRELPRGADIKVVWELSRWQPLVRLAQGAWILGDQAAADRCLAWLDDWWVQNPPFIGWNWTSPLEAGVRLINLAWIDAILAAAGVESSRLDRSCRRLVPAHAWFTWRHRSFGSSANNHLLGELAGLIVAAVRWPSLACWGAPLDELQARFEREVLLQFAPDGGNREQALNYQLFSFELAWQASAALRAAERPANPAVTERLGRAADFFATIQVAADPWDYGDSDSATVTPFFLDESRASMEWHAWLTEPASSQALRWWLGDPPPPLEPPACVQGARDWLVFPDSGQAVCWTGDWQLRWDLSPLGYLRTAAHGHLDALHCSIWLRGVALVIDPGTGAYYGDVRLRSWLASWAAHNGPHRPGAGFPPRLGPFLWGEPHAIPTWRVVDDRTMAGSLQLPDGAMRREVRRVADAAGDGWQIDDLFTPSIPGASAEFRVCWQFAPGTRLEPEPGNPRFYQGERRGVRFSVGLDAAWTGVVLVPETTGSVGFPVEGDLAGLCSSAFRRIEPGPLLRLSARGGNPAMYRTTFLIAA